MVGRRNLPGILILAVVVAIATAAFSVPAPPDLAAIKGNRVPDVELRDENGATFHLSDLGGKPILINPIFTRCPHVCPVITSGLAATLTHTAAPGTHYEALTVSFDPHDTPKDLAHYRKKLGLPRGWRLGVADARNRKMLLDAIDFHVEPVEGGGFAHPNVVVVLSGNLRVSGLLHGVVFPEKDVRHALQYATTGDSLVARFRPLIAAVMALSILTVLITLWATRKRGQPAR